MLKINNLSYQIKTKKILNDISFSLSKGELLVIIGPNGAGKSTLINSICGEINNEEDKIKLNNISINNYPINQISKIRAVLTQGLNVSGRFKVEEILMMGRYLYFKDYPSQNDWNIIISLAKRTDVFHLLNRYYDTLSGGEKQRVQFTRVLAQLASNEIIGLKNDYHDFSKLMILDEPLNNLDIKHQLTVLSITKEFCERGNSALVVLHDLNFTAHFADKILLLKNGSIVSFGTPREVLTESNVYDAYEVKPTISYEPIKSNPIISFLDEEIYELI